MKKNTITEQEINKLSIMFGIDAGILIALASLGLLNISKSAALLIQEEYHEMVHNGELPKTQIASILAEKYKISKSSIEVIIYDKVNNKNRPCDQCGTEISKYKYVKNNGVCNDCIATKLINQIKHIV
jgi:formylmethanofuran dehydrogenase subunit E